MQRGPGAQTVFRQTLLAGISNLAAVVGGHELRGLMRRFPAGVAIVGVDLEGERVGLTVGTLIPLSLEPPLVGFAVRREAALHELLRRSGGFGVSLLAAGQEAVAQHFACGVPPIALWEGIDVRAGKGPPLVAGAIGWTDRPLTTPKLAERP